MKCFKNPPKTILHAKKSNLDEQYFLLYTYGTLLQVYYDTYLKYVLRKKIALYLMHANNNKLYDYPT